MHSAVFRGIISAITVWNCEKSFVEIPVRIETETPEDLRAKAS